MKRLPLAILIAAFCVFLAWSVALRQALLFLVGIGLGADYGRVIMLVYGLDRREDVFGTYASIGGSAHFLAGANATILASPRARIVLISSGLGLRFSGDLSRIRIEPAGAPEILRPPADICPDPAGCAARGKP